MPKSIDVLSVGNAIVDLIADVDSRMLAEYDLVKGSMTLVNAEQAALRTDIVPHWSMASGGSAANTAAAVASLGGRSAYIGKVGDDHLGAFFSLNMRDIGVHFLSGERSATPTARCLAMITPDGERTMSTHLGACRDLSVIDVDSATVQAAKIVFLEGYLLDAPRSNAALIAAAELAKHQGTQVAISLSDRFCIQRNRAAFDMLVESGLVDIVIGNEGEVSEFCSLTDVSETPAWSTAKKIKLVTTLGSKGSAISLANGEHFHVTASPVSNIVDLVGAGDAFAAGFLFGQANDFGDARSVALGNKTAAVVVESKGARPHTPLSTILDNGERPLASVLG